MKPSRSWADLLLVAFAVALTGWGVHGLLQRDTAQRADPTAGVAAQEHKRPATPEAAAREARPVVRPEPMRADAATRYLPPSGFDPEFRDHSGREYAAACRSHEEETHRSSRSC